MATDIQRWQVTKALVFALGLLTSIRGFNKSIPLFDLGLGMWPDWLLTVFVCLVCASLIFKPLTRSYFLILFFTNLAVWMLNYSATGAFQLHAGISCFFVFIADNFSEEERKSSAALYLAAIFFAATAFKLNSNYLAGEEFISGNFLYSFYHYFPQSRQWLSLNWLPQFSIVIEFALALMVLFRPKVGLQSALIFFLLLSVLHSRVFFVYLCFLPFAFLFQTQATEFLLKKSQSAILQSGFFWFALILTIRRSFMIVHYPHYPWDLFILIIGLLIIQFYSLVIDKASDQMHYHKSKRIWVMPVFIGALSTLQILGAPSPIGYNVFSGSVDKERLYVIQVADLNTCRKIPYLFDITLNADSSFRVNKNYCEVTFPTLSGMQKIKKTLCSFDRNLNWTYKKRSSADWIDEGCHQYLEAL